MQPGVNFRVTDKNALVVVKDAATCNVAVRQVVGERPAGGTTPAILWGAYVPPTTHSHGKAIRR